jgi:hypothetical protein
MNTIYLSTIIAVLAKEQNMSGPKSPYGYDPIFHQALAAITLDQPRTLVLESEKNPSHMRALFNQFRNSWMIQSTVHHKRKEYEQEVACRQNYYRLMQYECRRTMEGIQLVARASSQATMRTEGKVDLYMPTEPERPVAAPQTGKKKPGVIDLKDRRPEELAKIPLYDPQAEAAAIEKVFGLKPKENEEQIIPDNPPLIDTSNKYGLPIGPPPGFLDKK